MVQKPRQITDITSKLTIHSPMTRTRLRIRLTPTISAAVLGALLLAPAAMAQDRSGNFLDNLFNRGDQPPADVGRPGQPQSSSGQIAQADPGDMSVRLDRIEGAMRQLTGTVEQLQYQNQQLQQQMKRMQDEADYRAQQGGRGGGAPPAAPHMAPGAPMNTAPMNTAPQAPGRRSDAFDPSRDPNAPGVPRSLNQEAGMPSSGLSVSDAPPIGAPGGRDAGQPLDLNTLAGDGSSLPPPGGNMQANAPMGMSQLPPPPPRNPSATGAQLATLPPTARPQDEYDLAYGYVLHKDYGLAEQAFRDFLRKHPDDRLVPDVQYWLGESLFQQQRYRDAAESFLAVSTKYDRSGKAPDSLLRLGQSLAGLNKKEAACATLAEVGRKYPKASAGVKRTVAQEQKRVHC
jgi:tol-pal system protein YbgF